MLSQLTVPLTNLLNFRYNLQMYATIPKIYV